MLGAGFRWGVLWAWQYKIGTWWAGSFIKTDRLVEECSVRRPIEGYCCNFVEIKILMYDL